MQKPLLLIFLALSLLQPSAQAVLITFDSNHPRDTKRARIFNRMREVKTPTGEAFKKQNEALNQLARQLCSLKEAEIVALLGPKQDWQDGAFAIPSFEAGVFILSGLIPNVPRYRKYHVDFYPVGDFAGLKIFYGGDGVTPSQARIYFRADDSFPALNDWRGFKKRLAWDTEHFNRLTKWLDARQESTAIRFL